MAADGVWCGSGSAGFRGIGSGVGICNSAAGWLVAEGSERGAYLVLAGADARDPLQFVMDPGDPRLWCRRGGCGKSRLAEAVEEVTNLLASLRQLAGELGEGGEGQWRHTLHTRMIKSEFSQEVVCRILTRGRRPPATHVCTTTPLAQWKSRRPGTGVRLNPDRPRSTTACLGRALRLAARRCHELIARRKPVRPSVNMGLLVPDQLETVARHGKISCSSLSTQATSKLATGKRCLGSPPVLTRQRSFEALCLETP